MLIAALGTIGMFVLIALHIPIGVAMAIAGVVGFALLSGWGPAVALLASGPVSVLSNMDLAVIPLFLLMGSFAGVSGLSADIYRLAYAMIGHRPGGLALATVYGCAGFAAICGSSIATAATMGRVALPEMLKRGYSPELATGTIAAGGTLGILIPPSLIMVIYAFLTEQFVITLFVAALIPGLIGIIVHLLAVQAVVWWNPEAGPAGSRTTWRERLAVLKECWGVIALILCVIVSIYGGIFTVNEAAALGAGLAFAFTVARGKLDWSTLWQVTRETATNTGMLYLIIAGASIFSSFMAVSKMPEALVTQISAFELHPLVVIFALIAVYIVLGCVFDELAAMVITLPFVLPLIVGMGYHPVWWGIIMVITIEIGLIAPPIGVNVFVLYGIAKTIPLRTIYWGIVPFFFAELACIVILILFPELILWLPRVAGYNL
ncbi:MAG TPA: TRAP transporter large permease [Hyphomicrobiaceae bacterium]|jgi:tripartite ATP-independent transporter DctM subunit|nr:TRAP transporter large permease [Hyphomicrobiaceae bacterium]